MTTGELEILAAIALAIFIPSAVARKSQRRKSRRKIKQSNSQRSAAGGRGSSNQTRSDEAILVTPLDELNWAEFERLLALYFRDQGNEVEETGVGGNDGGVDLVLIDRKTRERTAVQIKWRSRSAIGPDVIRELHSARWNTSPRCLYAMLITNSEITQQARREAEERHIKFWHGGVLEHRLSQWSKWNPKKKHKMRLSTDMPHREVAATAPQQKVKVQQQGKLQCVCGGEMVVRHNKQGQPFWGCSRFPKCRHTRSIQP